MKSKQSQMSNGSIESIGIGTTSLKSQPQNDLNDNHHCRSMPKLKEFTNAKLEPESGSPIGEYLYNCIGYIFYCPLHRRIMLSLNERNTAVWWPFVAIPPDKTWNMATTEGIAIIFSKDDSEIDPRLVKTIPVQSINCIHILRIQLPMSKKFIYRLIQLVTLDTLDDHHQQQQQQFKCCTSSKHLQWIDLSDAINGNINGLWGPEVPIFATYLIDSNNNNNNNNNIRSREISEIGFNVDNLIIELGFNNTIDNINNQQNNNYRDQLNHCEKILTETLNITRKDIEKIYSDYLEHCFPSIYMTYWSFCNYINDYFDDCDNILQLFQAFNQNGCGYLTFPEFFSGIISIEPNCPNTRQRIHFIFRYYDHDRRNHLDKMSLLRLLTDLNLNNEQISMIDRQIQDRYPLNFDKFLQLIIANNNNNNNNNNIMATTITTLCRSSSPLLINIINNFQQRNETRISSTSWNSRSGHFNNPTTTTITINQQQQQKKSYGPCLACRERNYEFASHCIRLDPIGRCVEARNILEHDDNDVIINNNNINDDDDNDDDENKMNDNKSSMIKMTMYQYSQDYVFSTVSIGSTFLDMLREFNSIAQQRINKNERQMIGFFAGDENNHDLFIRYVSILCQNIRAIFDCENRLMRINSSAYIIGDINGDLSQLIKMERALWTSVPVLANNYVFLGNYVNCSNMTTTTTTTTTTGATTRTLTKTTPTTMANQMSIECILYLFSLKIIAPNKFFLLRGHGEAGGGQRKQRTTQQNRFQSELIRKYGNKCGMHLYELINDIFNRMPLVLIIDESIICVNNTLPIRTTTSIDDINNVDNNDNPIIKEILYTVPKIFNHHDDVQCIDYLKRNGLTHLIRAGGVNAAINHQHLQQHNGFYVGSEKRIINLITVLKSSSTNMNKQNQSINNNNRLTVINVDAIKIRIIQIDTNE